MNGISSRRGAGYPALPVTSPPTQRFMQDALGYAACIGVPIRRPSDQSASADIMQLGTISLRHRRMRPAISTSESACGGIVMRSSSSYNRHDFFIFYRQVEYENRSKYLPTFLPYLHPSHIHFFCQAFTLIHLDDTTYLPTQNQSRFIEKDDGSS